MSEIKMPEKESAEAGKTVVDLFIKEMKENPKSALKFIKTLSLITRPWEAIGTQTNLVNEITVPQGMSAKDFIKSSQTGPFVSGYKLVTIFGDEVAVISKDTPKWKILILGEMQPDAPFVDHSKLAEGKAKKFVEDKLTQKGFIIG